MLFKKNLKKGINMYSAAKEMKVYATLTVTLFWTEWMQRGFLFLPQILMFICNMKKKKT